MQKLTDYLNNTDYSHKNKMLGELIVKFQDGNEEALVEILELNIDTINGVIKMINDYYDRKLNSHYDDMMQEGLMAVMEAAKKYKFNDTRNNGRVAAQPLTYIFSRCRTKMTKYVRQMHEKTASVYNFTDNDLDFISDTSSDDILNVMAVEEGMTNILKSISFKERRILEYKYWWGLSNVDIGLTMGLSPHTIAKKFRAAKKKLRNKFPNFRSDYIE